MCTQVTISHLQWCPRSGPDHRERDVEHGPPDPGRDGSEEGEDHDAVPQEEAGGRGEPDQTRGGAEEEEGGGGQGRGRESQEEGGGEGQERGHPRTGTSFTKRVHF